jgi:hypothetical protein
MVSVINRKKNCMTQTFTLNDLILGLYNEIDQNILERSIQEELLMLKEIKALKESKNNLPKVLFRPKKAITEKILQAAKHP